MSETPRSADRQKLVQASLISAQHQEIEKLRAYLYAKNEIIKAYLDAAGGRNPEELAYVLKSQP